MREEAAGRWRGGRFLYRNFLSLALSSFTIHTLIHFWHLSPHFACFVLLRLHHLPLFCIFEEIARLHASSSFHFPIPVPYPVHSSHTLSLRFCLSHHFIFCCSLYHLLALSHYFPSPSATAPLTQSLLLFPHLFAALFSLEMTDDEDGGAGDDADDDI